MVNKARYEEGLNDFTYCDSLSVYHPNKNPALITSALGFKPRVAHRAGEQHQTPTGRPLDGEWDEAYRDAELEVRDGEDIAMCLSRLAEQLKPAAHFLTQLTEEGGRIQCFLGVFANGLCDQEFPAKLLKAFGQLNVDLRIDYYGPRAE